jgi:hypothetical protein
MRLEPRHKPGVRTQPDRVSRALVLWRKYAEPGQVWGDHHNTVSRPRVRRRRQPAGGGRARWCSRGSGRMPLHEDEVHEMHEMYEMHDNHENVNPRSGPCSCRIRMRVRPARQSAARPLLDCSSPQSAPSVPIPPARPTSVLQVPATLTETDAALH